MNIWLETVEDDKAGTRQRMLTVTDYYGKTEKETLCNLKSWHKQQIAWGFLKRCQGFLTMLRFRH